MTVNFVVTDNVHSIPVSYTGVLPDLFVEGQGVVVRGRLGREGGFVAEEVLAKHDENYMPPEVAEALAKARGNGGRMIPELGQFALVLALCLSLAQATLPLIGAARGKAEWMALARPAAAGQFVFVGMAFAVLTYAFVTDDFSVEFVAAHSNSALPLHYKFAAVWGGHEGSLLLWIMVLAMWTLAVAWRSRSQPEEFVSRVLGVLGIVSFGIISFALLTSNPFARLTPPAFDGNDLNPLLQDQGMMIHPPGLYFGYVGMAVPFAFAVAALLTGRLDKNWARWTRPWTIAAWMFLTVGIALGSWWAYYELGWGGWWFWDPVENSSFMPWLMATALLHSLAVTEKRGIFKSWTVLLAIAAFSLSLLGTFLTRSPVMVSVHAFASDPTRGMYILMLLGVILRRVVATLCVPRRQPRGRGRLQVVVARGFPAREQHSVGRCDDRGAVRHVVSVVHRRSWARQDLGGSALFQLDVPRADAAVGGPSGRRHALRLAKHARIDACEASALAGGSRGCSWESCCRSRCSMRPQSSRPWAWRSGCGSVLTALLDPAVRLIRRSGPSLTRAHLGMCVAHFGVGVFILGATIASAYNLEVDLSCAARRAPRGRRIRVRISRRAHGRRSQFRR